MLVYTRRASSPVSKVTIRPDRTAERKTSQTHVRACAECVGRRCSCSGSTCLIRYTTFVTSTVSTCQPATCQTTAHAYRFNHRDMAHGRNHCHTCRALICCLASTNPARRLVTPRASEVGQQGVLVWFFVCDFCSELRRLRIRLALPADQHKLGRAQNTSRDDDVC